MQCKECDRLQCADCLRKWWERTVVGSGSKCPLCSKTKGFHDRVNNIVMNWLKSKLFKCNLCETQFTYENFEKHMQQDCELAKFRPDCQLCGQKEFDSEASIIEHWKQDCPRMKVVCERCTLEFHRNDEHDCVEALLKAREADKSLIKNLQEEIANLRGNRNAIQYNNANLHQQ